MKGLAHPVDVYEVTGAGAARSRLQAAAGRGLTRFVGRTVELQQMQRAQQLAEQGHGQVVTIVGQAGVGKSRLLHEFIHSQPTAGRLVLESGSTSYGHATPYLPVTELLRHYFKLNVQDGVQSIREKVSGKILSLDPSLQEVILPVLDLLNVLDDDHPFRSLDPIEHRQQTYQAVIRLLLSESKIQPVVAVFEDMPWYDSLSIGLLNELVVRAQDARLLLVVSCRPEYKDEWKGRPNYRQLRLNPLASESFAELLQALLGSDPSVETIKSFLIERASGNPFFVEEIVRSLVDGAMLEGGRGKYRLARPFVSNEVPPTVQAVLAARIDKLPATEKRLLQEAAVIGHDFSFTLLQAISGLSEDDLRALLDDLEAAEFLYTTQLFPDLQYTFTHALTHDVAYNELLRQRRRDIHAHVVDAMEKLYADQLVEHAERLAHHAVRGELKDQAVRYLHLAGGKAAARSALADARSCFEEALGILKELPESQAALGRGFELHRDLQSVLYQFGEGRPMLKHLREAEIIATQLKDDRRRGQVCAFMTTVQSTLDDLDEALDSGSRALEIAERLQDLPLRIIASSYLEQAHCYRGDYERVVALATDNLGALPADAINNHFGMAVPASIFDRAWLVMSLAELGRFSEAAKYEAEAIRIAEPTQHAFSIGWAHFAASMPHLLQGDWAKAQSLVEHWLMMLPTDNVTIHLPWALASSAWAMAETGDAGDTAGRIQEAEALLERQAGQGIVGHRSWAYHAVGRALLRLGQLDKAHGLAQRAIETSTRQPGFAAHAHHLLGDIAAEADRFDHEDGVGHYRDALALAQRHGMRPLVAHCHLGLGKIHRRAGKAEDAEKHHATATAMYRDMDMRFWLAQAQH
jgi:tetratricopeptide (TPR) repeat protein